MIDRDTIIDFVAAVDTEFMKRELGTYNGFDLYERFAMYVEAKVRKEEREACAALCFKMWNDWMDDESISELNRPDAEDCAHAIRARGEK
jgi:hypothetical protein